MRVQRVQSLDDTVPGTKYTARQICRVKRSRKPARAGTLLSYNGAYDNKYAIHSMKKIATAVPHEYRQIEGLYDQYEVVVRRLGKFFADGRMLPTPRHLRQISHVLLCQVPTGQDLAEQSALGGSRLGWRLACVEPSGEPLLPPNPWFTMTQPEKDSYMLAKEAWHPSQKYKKYQYQADRTDRQHELVLAVDKRTFQSGQFADVIADYLNLKTLKPKYVPQSMPKFNQGDQGPQVSLEPEAILAMFQIP